MFCRGTRRKRVETGAGQAVHRTEAAERANRGKSGLTLLPIHHPQGWLLWDTGLPDALAATPEGTTSANRAPN